MLNKEEIRKELSELSPGLEKIEKNNPFRIPDHYFQSLPDKVMERIGATAHPILWTDKLESWLNQAFSLIFQPRYAIPVTMILLSLVVGISFYKNKDVSFDIAQPLSEISSKEINEYIIENFDEGELIAFSSSIAQLNGFFPEDIPSEELENFLKNNSDNLILEEDLL